MSTLAVHWPFLMIQIVPSCSLMKIRPSAAASNEVGVESWSATFVSTKPDGMLSENVAAKS